MFLHLKKMFPKCFHFIILTVIFLLIQGTAGFLVKHVQTGMCIKDTSIIQSQGSLWGKLFFVELSNNCLDLAAQFRFRDNGAMLNLKRQGCLGAFYKFASGYFLDMFYIYVDAVSLDRSACAQKPDQGIYRAINQTSWGGLAVYYKGYGRISFQTWCAVIGHYKPLAENQGIDPYVKVTTSCIDAPDKRFHFGSVTCYGSMIKNANCPKDQYMVVKTASYRGLSGTKTCGSSDDYSCEVNVTCLVKKQCDGQHECNITVDDNLFPANSCQGFAKYLYFEYQCTDNVQRFTDTCILDVSLSNSSLPNEGFVQIITDGGKKNVCGKSLSNNAKNVVCGQLGYKNEGSLDQKAVPPNNKDAVFSGTIDCNGGEKNLSQCSITASKNSCSVLSYIKYSVCNRHLLKDEQKFPDSSFTASVSSEGHSASDGRISSGSSWCAPVSNDEHYLQVDLGRLYVIDTFVTFGDSTGSKWVTTYSLNYTVDLINWRPIWENMLGNTKAVNQAAIRYFSGGKTTRALRFIPLSYVGQPSMRIEICGGTLLPDKPSNIMVTHVTSRSVKVSWQDPKNVGESREGLTGVWIKLKKDNSLILNITTIKVNTYEINSILTPHTTYEISIAVGNKDGFGEGNISSLTTSEEAPEGPPLNVQVTAESSSSLSVTWKEPEKNKRNGMIVSYTVCISNEESKPCVDEITTKRKALVVTNLNASTKYHVRVLASTKIGRGNYSESKEKLTNGIQPVATTTGTQNTLTFTLQTPSGKLTYFYVVALKSKDGKEPTSSPDSYENNELVTYDEAEKSTNPKPYIAAVITSKNESMFILGDGRNTNSLTSRRRRSISSDYYNGPLEPGTSYTIFQRIFIVKEGDFYSTDWSPSSKTNEYKGKEENDDGSGKYLAVIIVVIILLIISLLIIAYLIWQNRRPKSSKENSENKSNGGNNFKEIYENPDKAKEDANYEQVEDEQSTYTALKRTGKEEDDDHLYGHLNEVLHDNANEKETGI